MMQRELVPHVPSPQWLAISATCITYLRWRDVAIDDNELMPATLSGWQFSLATTGTTWQLMTTS